VEEIPATVRNALELIPVSHVDQVLRESLITNGNAEFEHFLDNKAMRDEIFFSDLSKSSENQIGGAKPKDESATVVTH
jgi:hypothetical protein